MADWFVVGAVTIIVLFVIASFFNRRHSRYRQARYERDRESKASFEDHPTTIYIATPCYKDEDECAKTLFSLFNEADCPWRVTVGLLHHIDDANTPDPIDGLPTNAAAIIDDVINRYEQVCAQKDATPFASNIRTLVLPASEARGPWVARATIARALSSTPSRDRPRASSAARRPSPRTRRRQIRRRASSHPRTCRAMPSTTRWWSSRGA